MHKILIAFILFFQPLVCRGLLPDEILVIANRNAAKSVGLARYYMEKRNIPETNLLLLWVSDQETCSRKDYQYKIVPMIKRHLARREKENKIRCLVTVYGIPLKVSTPEMTVAEKRELENLQQQRKMLTERKEAKSTESPVPEKEASLKKKLAELESRMEEIRRDQERSALDSELALIDAEPYPLAGWIPNPNFLGFKNQELSVSREKVFLVSRLDGPTPEIVRRMIDDSIAAEKTGLSGTAYFDARWPIPEPDKSVSGYTLYDKSIHLAAERIKKETPMPVVVDHQAGLFPPGSCPGAALYCGWYSLGKYVGAFEWAKGAVGYHIASSECTTLKNPGSQVWCKRMLEEGVAATVGPTSEPYVQAFPVPEIFFGLLAEGRRSLAECYALSTPFLSWQMVLIGDPLYRIRVMGER